jgi:hypothetical protein
VHWYFRDISDDPSEKELTQLDQFNNDEVALAEALVRETVQNSTDAQVNSSEPVLVRFAITTNESRNDTEFFARVLESLKPHLQASGFTIPPTSEILRVLTIEDFGTSGLTGSVEEKDNGQFSGFWRRFGRSNKQGTKGGRWGLGKLVFPSSSSIRMVIGLTRRANENSFWVMGQAVLRNHSINGREKDSVGFWCTPDSTRNGIPTNNSKVCSALIEAAALARKNEPGLSLVVPYLLPEISADHLIAAAIKNYYFPILTRRLQVVVDTTTINAETFDNVAAALPRDVVSQSALDFVRLLQACLNDNPAAILPNKWQTERISEALLGSEVTTTLRDLYKNGKMVLIRAPLNVTQKDNGNVQDTYIDLFLKNAPPGERSQTLVVRGAITVPTEGKRINLLECHAALIATDEPIGKLLGDAENPAHTQWNERAEKLRAGWQAGNLVLRRVRAALPELYELINERIEREDPLALLDFFSIPKADRPATTPNVTTGRPQDLPPPQSKAFRIEKRAGGFAILPGSGIQSEALPYKFQVRCAYDVLTGNPFRRFSEFDFSFYGLSLEISKNNADCWPTQPNELDIVVRESNFKVDVVGFDPNRDLIIEAQG